MLQTLWKGYNVTWGVPEHNWLDIHTSTLYVLFYISCNNAWCIQINTFPKVWHCINLKHTTTKQRVTKFRLCIYCNLNIPNSIRVYTNTSFVVRLQLLTDYHQLRVYVKFVKAGILVLRYLPYYNVHSFPDNIRLCLCMKTST